MDGNGKDPGAKELLAVGKAAGMNRKACKQMIEEIQNKTAELEKKYHTMDVYITCL